MFNKNMEGRSGGAEYTWKIMKEFFKGGKK